MLPQAPVAGVLKMDHLDHSPGRSCERSNVLPRSRALVSISSKSPTRMQV